MINNESVAHGGWYGEWQDEKKLRKEYAQTLKEMARLESEYKNLRKKLMTLRTSLIFIRTSNSFGMIILKL